MMSYSFLKICSLSRRAEFLGVFLKWELILLKKGIFVNLTIGCKYNATQRNTEMHCMEHGRQQKCFHGHKHNDEPSRDTNASVVLENELNHSFSLSFWFILTS